MALVREPPKTILVTGAAGFIGRRLCALLVDQYSVRCLVRDISRAKTLLPPATEIVLGDMTDAASLGTAAKGCAAIVHLAALKSDERDIVAVNVGGARNLVAACKAAGVRRVINVGSQAGRMIRRGAYGDTKAQSDEIFNASGLEVTTLLPSVVYGPQDRGAFGKLVSVTAASPIVPVIGDGRTAYRPIHIDDVCAVIEGCLRTPKTIGKTYSVGGAETVTLEGFIDFIAARLGRKPLKVHIPVWAALMSARVLALIFDLPPLTRSNVLGAIYSAPDADYASIFAELGLKPRSFADGMKDSLP